MVETKKGRGRPAVENALRRQATIGLAVSVDLKERIKIAAAEEGISESEFVRRQLELIVGGPSPETPEDEGNNVTRMAPRKSSRAAKRDGSTRAELGATDYDSFYSLDLPSIKLGRSRVAA